MRVLLVDDEIELLRLLSQYLVRSGHEVITAETKAIALDEAAKEGSTLDAAVIDLCLPDGNGEDVARRIAVLHPHAKLIISTGYAHEPSGDLNGRVTVLQKPFLPRALLHVLSQAH
jgi:two-component system, cell cycle sensor histidine kinase and response regulator CckA